MAGVEKDQSGAGQDARKGKRVDCKGDSVCVWEKAV